MTIPTLQKAAENLCDHLEAPERAGWNRGVNERIAAVRAALAATSTAAPDGWQLVPVKLTPEMAQVRTWDYNRFYSAEEIWKELLAIAPRPPEAISPPAAKRLTDSELTFRNYTHSVGTGDMGAMWHYGFQCGFREAETFHGITDSAAGAGSGE